ncbi:hypothetical protein MBRA_06404 [Methylobacterium brachiatum]|nr:hypothetical protein MBRA_06404 [Methylobacterium brachiatum]
MIRPCDQFGPWAVDLDHAEQRARLRAMRALARVHCGPRGADLCRLLAPRPTRRPWSQRWRPLIAFHRTIAGICWRPTAPSPVQPKEP